MLSFSWSRLYKLGTNSSGISGIVANILEVQVNHKQVASDFWRVWSGVVCVLAKLALVTQPHSNVVPQPTRWIFWMPSPLMLLREGVYSILKL